LEKITLGGDGMNLSMGVNVKVKMHDALNKIFSRIVDGDLPEPAELPSLPNVVEQARQEYLNAQYYYNTVTDKDLVDHAVFLMQAAEKKYMYLLKQARQQGVTYSIYNTEAQPADKQVEVEDVSQS
jgi:hypothetical protein